MTHQYILLNVTSPDYVYTFPPNKPLLLNPGSEVALKNLFMWCTYSNISEKYNNNKFKVNEGNGFYDVTIPEGLYDIAELQKFLDKENINIKLIPNTATFHLKLELGENVEVDLSNGKFYELLGLEAKLYKKSEEGINLINITRSVDRILIRTDIIERQYQNEYRDVLMDVLPVGKPGAAISMQIENPEYHKCLDPVIRQIRIRVTDEKNELINFQENICLKIDIKV